MDGAFAADRMPALRLFLYWRARWLPNFKMLYRENIE